MGAGVEGRAHLGDVLERGRHDLGAALVTLDEPGERLDRRRDVDVEAFHPVEVRRDVVGSGGDGQHSLGLGVDRGRGDVHPPTLQDADRLEPLLGDGDLDVDLVVQHLPDALRLGEDAVGVLGDHLHVEGPVGAEHLPDAPEVRPEVDAALGLDDARVAGRARDGVDVGQGLDGVQVGGVEQDLHGGHVSARRAVAGPGGRLPGPA